MIFKKTLHKIADYIGVILVLAKSAADTNVDDSDCAFSQI